MNIVDITVVGLEEPSWIPRVEQFCLKILEQLQLDNWELSIVFCTNQFIRELNNRFREKNEVTDVLSFSQSEGEPFPISPHQSKTIGDVVISLDMVEANRQDTGEPWETELKRLLIHGILHLAGYDHEESDEEREMMDLQDRLLQDFMEERIRT
ncbi:MAG: rRNA maturation RNase YbeY [Spirochaetes bacterium]|nr:rRNA maturation RNase YbeY [Spirochaetota bacterium]